MIDISKQYQTRDGREVRIYATDGEAGTVHGAILTVSGWAIRSWRSDGRRMVSPDADDIIEVRPRHKRTVWVNLYGESDNVAAYTNKWKANQSASHRIACIKVELDFEEGEGL